MICSDTQTLGGMVVAVNSAIQNTKAPVFFHLVTISEEMDHVVAWLLHYHPFIIMEVSQMPSSVLSHLMDAKGLGTGFQLTCLHRALLRRWCHLMMTFPTSLSSVGTRARSWLRP